MIHDAGHELGEVGARYELCLQAESVWSMESPQWHGCLAVVNHSDENRVIPNVTTSGVFTILFRLFHFIL